MENNTMEITKQEMLVIRHALKVAMEMGTKMSGSITLEEMGKLESKIHYHDFCRRRGITYEQMDDLDFEAAYLEEYEA